MAAYGRGCAGRLAMAPVLPGPTYLVLHDALLKSRPAHGNLPWVLAPAPDALAVRRLQRPQLLSLCRALLQHLVERALRGRGQRIGLRDIRLCVALGRVVGRHLVGRCRCRGVGGAQEGCGAAGAQCPKSERKHCGRSGGCMCRRAAQWLDVALVRSGDDEVEGSGVPRESLYKRHLIDQPSPPPSPVSSGAHH